MIDVCDAPPRTTNPRIAASVRPDIGPADRQRYDIVVASAVLEHVPNPGEAIRSLLESLRPGGMFYARTPCHLPMAKLLRIFGYRFDIGYPTHLHDMGSEFWNRLPVTIEMSDQLAIVRSKPSMVSSTLASNFGRTVAAHLCKAPWYVFGDRYQLVGGWEIFIRRRR